LAVDGTQERKDIDVKDAKGFKHSAGLSVVDSIVEATNAVRTITKYLTVAYGSGKARKLIGPLKDYSVVVDIVDGVEHRFFNEWNDLKRRAKEEKPLLEAKKQRALDRIKLNTKTQAVKDKQEQERPDWVASAETIKLRDDKIKADKKAKAFSKAEAIAYKAELAGVPE